MLKVLADIPNQEEFKNLTVEPADIRPQCSSWETSKRLKAHSSEAPKQQLGNRSAYRTETTENDRDARTQSDGLASPDDTECEILVFRIGAASMRDMSKPMPPPTRFVRRAENEK